VRRKEEGRAERETVGEDGEEEVGEHCGHVDGDGVDLGLGGGVACCCQDGGLEGVD
jgi:hypothetical protein